MKKFIIIIILNSQFLIVSCFAQWESDVRLTNDPAGSYTSLSWCIAASGNVVHVVWEESRDGNTEIYYKRSPDGGVSWGADTRLTNNSANSFTPSVSVSGSAVHVVWRDDRDGNAAIYYKRSIGGGVSWGADTRLSNSSGFSQFPSVSVFGSVLHVVWEDQRDGNAEIYYKRSTDGGSSWGTDTRLTNNSANSFNPSVSASGSVLHVVWEDHRDGNDGEIYYKRSTDGGVSWGADTRLTNNSVESFFPSVSVSDSAVHVVWRDNRDGNSEIYYKRSTDAGTNWETDTRLTNNPASSGNPSVSVSGSVVHVVWYDNRDGNLEIYYKRNPTGNSIGIQIISSEVPKEFKLEQNYPNPFNPTTRIKFDVPKTSNAKLAVYDALGRQLAVLVNEELRTGTYQVDWDGRNYASGIYFYTLITDNFTDTRKMVCIK